MKPNRGNVLIGLVVIAALAILHDRFDPRKASAGAPFGGPFACAATLPPSEKPPKLGDGSENLGRPAEDFFPAWAASARFNQPVLVRDTQSALGRLSPSPKEISLKDLARMHGQLPTERQMCDWLNVSKRHLFCWRTAKLIPFIKIGRAVRFRAADVQRALDSMTIEPKP
jgi:excisionase family DNA binding protein